MPPSRHWYAENRQKLLAEIKELKVRLKEKVAVPRKENFERLNKIYRRKYNKLRKTQQKRLKDQAKAQVESRISHRKLRNHTYFDGIFHAASFQLFATSRGLPLNEFSLLVFICLMPEITNKEAAKFIAMTERSANNYLRWLCRREYLTRFMKPDKKYVYIATPKGHEIFDGYKSYHRKLMIELSHNDEYLRKSARLAEGRPKINNRTGKNGFSLGRRDGDVQGDQSSGGISQ